MTTDTEIITNLTAALKQKITTWYGPEAVLVEETPIRVDRPWSLFFYYTVQHADRHADELVQSSQTKLIVKMFREDYMTTLEEIVSKPALHAVAVREAETLQNIEAFVLLSSISGLAAIHCPGALKEFSALAMEELPFQSFNKKNYAKLPPFTAQYWQTVEDEIARAGQWVRLFHESSGEIEAAPLHTLIGDGIEYLFAAIEQITGKSFLAQQTRLTTAYETLKDRAVPVAMLHNDLSLNNIFITDDGRVGGFDPVSGVRGAVYQDLAELLTDTFNLRRQILSQGLIFSPAFNRRIQDNFLRGYGIPIDEKILHFYTILQLLHIWREQEQEFQNSPLRLYVRGFFLRTLRAHLAGLA